MELKRCPFCNGKAHITGLNFGETVYLVICEQCKARTTCRKAKEEAVNAWNNRIGENFNE